MWFVIGLVVFLFFLKSDKILEALKSKDPIFQKEKAEKQKLEIEERDELLSNLKENIGNICTIKSKELIYIAQKNEMTGKILDVDEDWIELEYTSKGLRKKETVNHLVFKTSNIESFSRSIDSKLG